MLFKCIISFWISVLATVQLVANTIIVHPLLPVKNIKQALQQAHNGDTILIKKARYAVSDQVIDKSVNIIGENYPVLDGQMRGDILIIQADQVVVSGIRLCNTNKGSMRNYAGIRCDEVKNITIENNRFVNTLFPIYLPKTNGGIIKDNIITGNSTAMESGSGIYLWYASDIIIEHNQVSGQRDGIYFEFSTRCLVSNNTSERNYRYGLHFMFSDSNSYTRNVFRDNGAGVAVMYSKHISMVGNRFEHNWGPSAYGLLLKEINDSRISDNFFEHNTTGIFMESCNRNKFIQNTFAMNGWAINLLADCIENHFNNNSFRGNTFDVGSNGNPGQNFFNANYWDKYSGYDLNKDGKGDIPYYPVSLYSKIIESIPYAIVLYRSFIVSLLEQAEQSIPSLVPVSIIDRHPRMKFQRP